jgi:hypothetical protein
MTYRPRAQTKRWLDGDCPDGVLAIFDHPDSFDRYTVFYKEPTGTDSRNQQWFGYRGMSENPTHPQGFGQWGEMEAVNLATFRRQAAHCKAKWSDLPEAVKAIVRADLAT